MSRLNLFMLLLTGIIIWDGCYSPSIRKESFITAKKQFQFTKKQILKNFSKINKDKLYINPTPFDYYNFAFWNNKEIDKEIAKLLQIYTTIQTVFYEDPGFEISFAPLYGIFKSGAPFTREFMIFQKFPTAEKLPLEKKVIYNEFKSLYYNIINTMLEVEKEITINFLNWEKFYLLKNIKSEKIRLLRRIKKYVSASLKFTKDDMLFKELIYINLDISQLKKEIFEISSAIENIKNNIATLLYIKDYKTLRLPDLKVVKKLGRKNTVPLFSNSPLLKKYKAIIKKTSTRIERATRNFVPDIMISLGLTLKSMDPVGSLMGKKGILSSLMLNLPIYREKLESIFLSSIYENLVSRYEYNEVERKLLQNYISNDIEKNIYRRILLIIKKEEDEIRRLVRYLYNLNKAGKSGYKENTQIKLELLNYRESYIDTLYKKIIKGLENRFLVGKFILGGLK